MIISIIHNCKSISRSEKIYGYIYSISRQKSTRTVCSGSGNSKDFSCAISYKPYTCKYSNSRFK